MKLIKIIFAICLTLSQTCLFGGNYNANLMYTQSGNASDVLVQQYGFSEYLQPTKKITLSGSVKYNKIKRSTEKEQIITPTIFLNINNDIFNLDISNTQSSVINSKKNNLYSSGISINVASFYKKLLHTKINYSENKRSDSGKPKKINQKSHSYGLTVGRTVLKFFDFSYDYQKNVNKDYVNNDKSVSTSDNVRTSLKNIHNVIGRFRYNVAMNYNYRRNIMQKKVNQQGYAMFPVAVNVIWLPMAGNEKTYLPDNQTFILDLQNKEVDAIYFYINSTNNEEISPVAKWNIYWHNDTLPPKSIDEEKWEPVAMNVSFPYKFNERFKKGGYIKIVAKNVPADTIEVNFPYLQCYIFNYSTDKYATLTSQNRDFTSSVLLGYKISDNLTTNYSVNYKRNNPSIGKLSENIYHHLGMNWLKSEKLSSSINISDNIRKIRTKPTNKTFTFAYNVNAKPVETIDVSGAFTHTLNKVGSRRTNLQDNYLLSLNTSIFPGLTLRWGNSFTMSKSYETHSTTKSYNLTVSSIARFTKKLTVVTNYNFNRTLTPPTNTSQNLAINTAWRISEFFFVNLSETYNIPDKGVTNINHNLSTWIALNRKIQTNFTYSGTRGKNKTDTFTYFLLWKVSNKISFKYSYTKSFLKGEKKWNTMVSLNASF